MGDFWVGWLYEFSDTSSTYDDMTFDFGGDDSVPGHTSLDALIDSYDLATYGGYDTFGNYTPPPSNAAGASGQSAGSSDSGIAELPLSVDPDLLNIVPGTISGILTEDVTSWIIPGTTAMLSPGDPGYPGTAPGAAPPGSNQDLGVLVTGLGALTHPLDLIAVNGTFFLAGGGGIFAGGLAIGGGCLEPTPFEPLTCFAGVLGGGLTIGGGVHLLDQGVSFFENYTLPAIEHWGGGE